MHATVTPDRLESGLESEADAAVLTACILTPCADVMSTGIGKPGKLV